MEGKVLLQDLAQSLASNRNIQRKDAEVFLKAFFETISEGILQDKIVKIKGLGTFKMIEVQDRESVNVNTGERIVIPGHSKISFTPDAELKDLVNKPFALFQTVIINEGTSLEDMERTELSGESLELSSDNILVTDDTQDFSDDSSEENVDEPVTTEVPDISTIPVTAAPTIPEEEPEQPEEPEEEQPLAFNAQQPTTNKRSWWYINPAMLALLFALFWIVFLLGYFIGSKNWLNIDQFFSKPAQEPVVKVDTVFIEKTVEPDTTYIQDLKDSLRSAIQEENTAKKEQPKAQVSQVSKPTSKPESKPVTSTIKTSPVTYEIVGQKGTRTIQWGDYLLKIVRQEYGNEDALKYVILYNKFTDPNNLPVGTVVRLPKLKEK